MQLQLEPSPAQSGRQETESTPAELGGWVAPIARKQHLTFLLKHTCKFNRALFELMCPSN